MRATNPQDVIREMVVQRDRLTQGINALVAVFGKPAEETPRTTTVRRKAKARVRLTTEDWREFDRLWSLGWPVAKLSKRFNVHYTTAYARVRLIKDAVRATAAETETPESRELVTA